MKLSLSLLALGLALHGTTASTGMMPTHTVEKGQPLRKLDVISSKEGKLETELTIAPMRINVPSVGLSFTTRAYNSQFPASTLRVNPGDEVAINVVNNLGPQSQGCKEVKSGVLKPNQFRVSGGRERDFHDAVVCIRNSHPSPPSLSLHRPQTRPTSTSTASTRR